ncbi:thyrotropin releasing hormone [Eulemur rufifrons]|uniref:thyrotropin releasing hormone n=1 Tax=Eulemur rufifrons TaxID=859984 RepID=UPI00374454A9
MPGPWLLLALALTVTLTSGDPGGRAQPQAAPREVAERPGLDDLLSLLFLPETLQRLQGDPSEHPESQILESNWLSKRPDPGNREEEEEAEEGVEEEEEEERGGAGGPQKRQHPGRREEEVSPFVDGARHKRQHPGRRSPGPGYAVTKWEQLGRRRGDAEAQRSWAEEEEEEEEEEELTPGKRQHPGKRSLGRACGPQGACRPASVLLGLLGDLSRGQGAEQKRQHPGRRAAWVGEPLKE